MYLSIVIPAYNEEKRIEKTLFEINKYFLNKSFDYEILVVDDGSKDRTLEVVESLKAKIKNLRLITNKKNHGKGYVVRQGLLQAKGELRLFTDADNSTPIEELEKFLPEVNKYDIIIGSRDTIGSKIIKSQPFYRKILGRFYGPMSKIIIGLSGINDTQCGFKLFNGKSADDILKRCVIDGWSFDSEALLIAKKLGYKIKEMPVNWYNDPDTKVKFSGMVKTVFDLIRIRCNFISGKYKKYVG